MGISAVILNEVKELPNFSTAGRLSTNARQILRSAQNSITPTPYTPAL